MPNDPIEIKLKPPDLLRRLNGYSKQAEDELYKASWKSFYHIAGSVPSYPEYQSSYKRTGTLGRSLTIGGPMNIKEVKKLGGGVEARFGTRVNYAVWVIGDPPGKSQAKHMRHWWTMATVRKEAEKGIIRIFDQAMERIANWIEGQGL